MEKWPLVADSLIQLNLSLLEINILNSEIPRIVKRAKIVVMMAQKNPQQVRRNGQRALNRKRPDRCTTAARVIVLAQRPLWSDLDEVRRDLDLYFS